MAQLISTESSLTISLPEAARLLGVSRTTAWSLYSRGEFPVPVLKIGGCLRVVKQHLLLFLETGVPVEAGTRIHIDGGSE